TRRRIEQATDHVTTGTKDLVGDGRQSFFVQGAQPTGRFQFLGGHHHPTPTVRYRTFDVLVRLDDLPGSLIEVATITHDVCHDTRGLLADEVTVFELTPLRGDTTADVT